MLRHSGERDKLPDTAEPKREDTTGAAADDQTTARRVSASQINLQFSSVGGEAVEGRESEVADVAERGTSGAGTTLPYLDQIQRSFGKHDVTKAEAHMGSSASESSEQLGARAYTVGDKVAFQHSPDLRIAAHEAAHVVQQRGGVQLKGNVGQAGDEHEQHADAVADRVVSGETAEPLLDRYVSRGTETKAVQGWGWGGLFGGGDKDGDKDEGKKQEEPGSWLRQQQKTKDSFFDLIRQNLLAAGSFESLAEIVDPPPAWQTMLSVVGQVALAAALGGVGGVLAGKFVKEGMGWVATMAINAAIDGGKKAAEEGVGVALGKAPEGKKKPLVAFCEHQKFMLSKASKEAREGFVDAAGTFTDQKLTIDQMQTIHAMNDDAFAKAQEIQTDKMMVGWMNLAAGKEAIKNSDLEDTSQKGILGLVVAGVDDRPTSIVKAQIEGSNSPLRGRFAGTQVKEWVNGSGDEDKAGLDVVVRTGDHTSRSTSFDVSNATKQTMIEAGVFPESGYGISRANAIWFAVGQERNGGTAYVDNDKAWAKDYGTGATAGRWFLKNVKNTSEIMKEVGELRLGKVGD